MEEKKDGNGNYELKRELKTRHLTMIAIGGSIGTGLFVGMGFNFTTAGPGGTLLAYIFTGITVYFMMYSLGEMSTYLPLSGSFSDYCTRFVDPAFGFAVGIGYAISWPIVVGSELVAGVMITQYWFPNVNPILLSLVFLAIIYLLNVLTAKGYGEGEFWFSTIKVFTVLVFLILGLLMILGVLGGTSPGVSNWTTDKAPFVGGAVGVISCFLIAGYSFQGTEAVGIASGETADPAKTMPKAIKSVFWRILIFYIGTVIVIGFLISYKDPNLAKTGIENISYSPFTLVFKRAGLSFAATVMNAVILSAVLSCGNAGLYLGSRLLSAMAKNGQGFKYFGKINKRGIPFRALNLCTIIAGLCFLLTQVGLTTAYYWLLNIGASLGFLVWFAIAISHLRFRKAYLAQGNKLEDLKFKAKLFPFGPIFTCILCIVIMIGQYYANGVYSFMGLVVAYGGLVVVFIIFLAYKFIRKTKFVKLSTPTSF